MSICALVGASEFNEAQFMTMYEADAFDYIIAVDGGFASLEACGVKPDMAVGDFDSLGFVPKGMRVLKMNPEKAKSDMEIALERARAMKYDSAIVFGALGGRLDHTLANMQVFSKFNEKGIGVTAIGMSEMVVFLTGPESFEIPARESGTISVFSMNDVSTGVNEQGMKWDLDDVILTNRTSLGLSNEFVGKAVIISVEEGTLALILQL